MSRFRCVHYGIERAKDTKKEEDGCAGTERGYKGSLEAIVCELLCFSRRDIRREGYPVRQWLTCAPKGLFMSSRNLSVELFSARESRTDTAVAPIVRRIGDVRGEGGVVERGVENMG